MRKSHSMGITVLLVACAGFVGAMAPSAVASSSCTVTAVDSVNGYLNGINGTPHDLWAVGGMGQGVLLTMHFDGTTWTTVDAPERGGKPPHAVNSFEAVSVAPSGRAWAVGSYNVGFVWYPLIEWWNGTKWKKQTGPPGAPLVSTLFDVLALSNKDVWAVGLYGLEHFDGTSWSDVSPAGFGRQTLYGIDGTSPDDIWAVGFTSALHWDGSTWTVFTLPVSANDVAMVSTNDVWAVGSGTEHWDGTSWTEVASPQPGFAQVLKGVSATDKLARAVGYYADVPGGNNYPLFERWNGSDWRMTTLPDSVTSSQINDVKALGTGGVWAAAGNQLLHC